MNSKLDSANSTISSLKDNISDLENKLHKIGQTEQTIFLNSQKNNRDYCKILVNLIKLMDKDLPCIAMRFNKLWINILSLGLEIFW